MRLLKRHQLSPAADRPTDAHGETALRQKPVRQRRLAIVEEPGVIHVLVRVSVFLVALALLLLTTTITI